jgi:hypothetical protein
MDYREQINLVASLLENALQLTAPGYNKDAPEEQLQQTLEGKAVEVDAMTALNMISVLNNVAEGLEYYGAEKMLIANYQEHLEKLIKLKDGIKSAGNKDKAYRSAAREMGWTQGGKTPDNDLLIEYLALIGVACAEDGSSSPELAKLLSAIGKGPSEQILDKEEAITFLTEKKQIASWDATYQRLKRAAKNRKNFLQSQKKDFSHLINILPTYIDNF